MSTLMLLAQDDAIAETSSWWSWVEPTTSVTIALLLIVGCVIAWGLNIIALPGNWIAVAIIALYTWLGPAEGRTSVGWLVLVGAVVCAAIGELVEFLASALGAQKAGASRKATVYAVIGSMLGAIGGAFIGVPVPIVGSIIAAILFGGLGATAGAMYGEWSNGKTIKESWGIGHAAFWGRTFGTVGKIACGFGIIIFAVAGVVLM